ncbi:MAG: hypothetical protein LUG99_00545 [Lachnospiraceae bacterium]|nr:hypothetical protein [Lachnospiraceae bacterium]
MNVVKKPETGTNFVDYEVSGNVISFNDGELMFNVAKKERDYKITIDICEDYTGGLVIGAASGDKYIAQLEIPAREYTEVTTENTDGEGTESTMEAVPFSMDDCTLTLWEMEA